MLDAGVAELADAADLKSAGEILVGSSPSPGTTGSFLTPVYPYLNQSIIYKKTNRSLAFYDLSHHNRVETVLLYHLRFNSDMLPMTLRQPLTCCRQWVDNMKCV